jgi:hypothetical protein
MNRVYSANQVYSQEYFNTIKQFLYMRIYIEYKLQPYKELDNPESWDKIFNKFNPIIKYYMFLRNKMEQQQIEENTKKCYFPNKELIEMENPHLFHYKQNQYSVYETETFQEYINRHIATVNNQEYNTFIQNMQNKVFKQQMLNKYEQDQYEIQIKHNLIYIVYLQVNPQKHIITKRQKQYLKCEIQPLDLAPYFEYLTKKTKNEIPANQSINSIAEDIHRAYFEDCTIQLINKYIQ